MPTIYIKGKTNLPERKEFDFYPTPIEFCRKAFSILPEDFDPHWAFDPGYGTGVWGDVLKEKYPFCLLEGCEIRDIKPPKSYDLWHKDANNGNFLEHKYPSNGDGYDLIFGNPPYGLAEEFIDTSLNLLKNSGYMMFLFRLSVLEGVHRFNKYYGNGLNPKEVWVSIRRISFTGNRKSSSDAYALYLWQKGYLGETKLKWLDWNYE